MYMYIYTYLAVNDLNQNVSREPASRHVADVPPMAAVSVRPMTLDSVAVVPSIAMPAMKLGSYRK